MKKLNSIAELKAAVKEFKPVLDLRENHTDAIPDKRDILVCGGTGCTSSESLLIIEKLKEEIKHDENIIKQQSDFIPRCEELLDNYWSLDTESKNKMLKSLIEKVTYSKDTKNAYGKGNEIGFQLDIFPKIQKENQ